MSDEFTGAATPLAEADLVEAADTLGCELAAVKAVAEVESAGGGFLADGRPKILFESYQFHQRTKGAYDVSHPHISRPRWERDYKGGAAEYGRLADAIALDRRAALLSASWGRFQIMGFNYTGAGFDDVEPFVRAHVSGEPEQLRAFVRLIQNWGLADALRGRRWAEFARRYNGAGYKQNAYDTKLDAAYRKHGGRG